MELEFDNETENLGDTAEADDDAEAERLSYTVPVGESGAGLLTGAGASDSLLRVYQFERVHAASHNLHARLSGLEVESQDISIKTGLDDAGRLVAVAGATLTLLAEPEDGAATMGDTELVRELAYAGNSLGAAGGEYLYGMSKRASPRIITSGTAAGALRVRADRETVLSYTGTGLLETLRGLSGDGAGARADAVGVLEQATSRLSAAVAKLQGDAGALSPFSVRGGGAALSAALSGNVVETGAHTVAVERLASAHSVRTKYAFATGVALSKLHDENGDHLLSGNEYSFSLNGSEIVVTGNDTLQSLAAKINYGTDGDGEFSGGTSEHGVRASTIGGKLTLTATEAGPQEINVDDTGGLLTELGLFKIDENGTDFADEVTQAAGSVVTIDGETRQFSGNTVTRAIAGVTLELQEAGGGEEEISIFSGYESLQAGLSDLVNSFNDTIRSFNDQLNVDGLLKSEERAERAYLRLRGAVDYPAAAQAGLTLNSEGGLAFDELQLYQAALDLQTSGGVTGLQNATSPASVYNSLKEIGITNSDDNTLAVDEDALSAAIADDAESVRELFYGEGGVLARLESASSQATKALGRRRSQLESSSGSGSLAKMRKAAQTYEQNAARTGLTQALLATG